MPLLLNYAVVVGGSRGVGVDRGQGTGALDELDELVVVAVDPLLAERDGQCRPERKGLAGRVDVKDGGTR